MSADRSSLVPIYQEIGAVQQITLALAYRRGTYARMGYAENKSKADEENPTLTCPNCGRTGKAEELFGKRVAEGGSSRWQVYCRDCRDTPRKPENRKPE